MSAGGLGDEGAQLRPRNSPRERVVCGLRAEPGAWRGPMARAPRARRGITAHYTRFARGRSAVLGKNSARAPIDPLKRAASRRARPRPAASPTCRRATAGSCPASAARPAPSAAAAAAPSPRPRSAHVTLPRSPLSPPTPTPCPPFPARRFSSLRPCRSPLRVPPPPPAALSPPTPPTRPLPTTSNAQPYANPSPPSAQTPRPSPASTMPSRRAPASTPALLPTGPPST